MGNFSRPFFSCLKHSKSAISDHGKTTGQYVGDVRFLMRHHFLVVLVYVIFVAVTGCDSNKPSTISKMEASPTPAVSYFARFAKVTEVVVKQQTDWDPSQPLPKSVDELSKIVVTAYTPSASQPKTGWKLNSITFFHVPVHLWPGLSRVDDEVLKDKWYCRIYISAFGDYKGEWWKNQAEASLFLDGTIISPPTAVE